MDFKALQCAFALRHCIGFPPRAPTPNSRSDKFSLHKSGTKSNNWILQSRKFTVHTHHDFIKLLFEPTVFRFSFQFQLSLGSPSCSSLPHSTPGRVEGVTATVALFFAAAAWHGRGARFLNTFQRQKGRVEICDFLMSEKSVRQRNVLNCGRSGCCASIFYRQRTHRSRSNEAQSEIVVFSMCNSNLNHNFQGLCDASLCSFSRSIVVSQRPGSSSSIKCTRLPENAIEIKFLRIISKRKGFSYCAIFACTLRPKIYLEGFIT
jgi:hypothetical protein